MERKASPKRQRLAFVMQPRCERLRQLGLNAADLQMLERQGYLSLRNENAGRAYWRLRFRTDGCLRTIYVGTDALFVAALKRELEELRRTRARRLQRQRTLSEEKRRFRSWKRRTAVLLAPYGYYFHGDSLRKARRSNPQE